MFRYGRSAARLVNIKKINSLSSTRTLSLSLLQSNNSNNNGKSRGNYGSISLLASMLVGAVITVSTHKVYPILSLTNYSNLS